MPASHDELVQNPSPACFGALAPKADLGFLKYGPAEVPLAEGEFGIGAVGFDSQEVVRSVKMN
jgi:hypothetical protein